MLQLFPIDFMINTNSLVSPANVSDSYVLLPRSPLALSSITLVLSQSLGLAVLPLPPPQVFVFAVPLLTTLFLYVSAY